MKGWRLVAAAVCALLLVSSAQAVAARKSKKRARPKPTPRVTKPARPIYGPPTPVPVVALRAAGSCLGYEPGHFLLLAEVGQSGRVFRIDRETVFHVTPQRGARIRLLYVETPDGPLAREVLPGPVAEED